MYTLIYLFRLVSFLVTIAYLTTMLRHARVHTRVILVVVIALLVYLIFANDDFKVWMRLKTNKSAAVVPIGSAWSLFLNKKSLCGKPVRAKAGLLENGRWGAATRICDLQKALLKKSKTLSSYPSVEDGTLGGWIASCAHGSGGTLWTPNFGKIKVKNLSTGETVEASPKDIFNDAATIEESRKYLIEEVEITPTDNVWCRKRASKIRKVEDLDVFYEPSHLRILQVGRRGIMCLVWLEDDGQDCDHVDPHFGSQFGLWLQSDALSILQSANAKDKDWFNFPVEPSKNFASKIKLADANKYTPAWNPLLTACGLSFVNFEIFVLDVVVSQQQLFDICNSFVELLQRLKGRCEIRVGKDKLFLDLNLAVGSPVRRVFELVRGHFGESDISIHKGKAYVDPSPYLQKPGLNLYSPGCS